MLINKKRGVRMVMRIDKIKKYDVAVDVTFSLRLDGLEAYSREDIESLVDDLAYDSVRGTGGAYQGCDIYELEEIG